MKILVLNAGSSSIKYSLYEMDNMSVLVSGVIERIGEADSLHKYCLVDANGSMQETADEKTIDDHGLGLKAIISVMKNSGLLKDVSELLGIGHRVVHGGEMFHQPTLIDDTVLEGIRKMVPLAPLHNPANLAGIEITLQHAADIPQVAVFDTAFHQSIPPHAFHYALPKELYEQLQVRRYGFHGTSHYYVAKQAAKFLNKPLSSLNLIVLHLGNGASATAIQQGLSVDTSMGMTPLEGLVMGTRSGDIDPAIPYYLSQNKAMSGKAINTMLNKESGLKGLCRENDMRAVHQKADAGDDDAQLALDIYCYRIKKYIGAYFAILGRIDALVFTGGIGENDVYVREKTCTGLEMLGIAINPQKNRQESSAARDISTKGEGVSVLVIPTNEELEIAMQTMACIQENSK